MAYDLQAEFDKIDAEAERKKSRLRDIAGVLNHFEKVAKAWQATGHEATMNVDGTIEGYGYLYLYIRPEEELGIAEDFLQQLFDQFGEVDLEDATSDWMIGKRANFKFKDRPEDTWATKLHMGVFIGRSQWIGEPDVEGAACTRRQVGVRTISEPGPVVTVEKPVYELVCKGGPDGNLPH